jgi:hypothetical protein
MPEEDEELVSQIPEVAEAEKTKEKNLSELTGPTDDEVRKGLFEKLYNSSENKRGDSNGDNTEQKLRQNKKDIQETLRKMGWKR